MAVALNSWVSIMTRAAGADSLGQAVGAWSVLVCEGWADILHPSGREAIAGGGEVAIVKASVRMHRRDDVHEGMRLHHRAAAYDIQAILPDDRNRDFMMLVCQKVVA